MVEALPESPELASNVPPEALRWDRASICREFGLSLQAVSKALVDAQIRYPKSATLSTRQITEALWGSLKEAKLKELEERRLWFKLRNDRLRGLVLDKAPLADGIDRLFAAMKREIMGLDIPLKDRTRILDELADLPLTVLQQSERQEKEAGTRQAGETPGDDEEVTAGQRGPRSRPRKARA